jgi:hypothetical protein
LDADSGDLVAVNSKSSKWEVVKQDVTRLGIVLVLAQPRPTPILRQSPGWAWYSEEKPSTLDSRGCIADPTSPDGTILASGQETGVTLAQGQLPGTPDWPYANRWDICPAG